MSHQPGHPSADHGGYEAEFYCRRYPSTVTSPIQLGTGTETIGRLVFLWDCPLLLLAFLITSYLSYSFFISLRLFDMLEVFLFVDVSPFQGPPISLPVSISPFRPGYLFLSGTIHSFTDNVTKCRTDSNLDAFFPPFFASPRRCNFRVFFS